MKVLFLFMSLCTAALTASLACNPLATWSDTPAAGESRPINCVDWYQSFAFCIWDGGRLPTEAENNFASAGGAEQRVYPWSQPPSSTVIDDTYAVYGCTTRDGGCTAADPPSVGSRSPKGDGRWGHSDLSGSVNDWIFDESGPYPSPCVDCANLPPASGGRRVKRGEDFVSALFLRTDGRDSDLASFVYVCGGFRCAR